jgi:hypothetical protein
MIDSLEIWRHDLDPTAILADPHVPLASTLMDVADRLAAVSNVLATLSDDRPDEKEFGVAVAGMAVQFAVEVLQHLGQEISGPELSLINIKMASLAINNLLAAVDGHLADWQGAAPTQTETTAEMVIGPQHLSAATAAADQQTDPAKVAGLTIDRNTFTVWYKGTPCTLGNRKPFQVLERLAKSEGVCVHYDELVKDVWKNKAVSDEAVQRQISTLRIKLRTAGIKGIEIDGKSNPGHYMLILR